MPLGGLTITGLSAPWLLAAFIGAGAVVALHLIDPRRARPVLYPAAAILVGAPARARASGRRRLARWVLIAARALVVALALLAFDRPHLASAARGPAGERTVIVLDVSASMAMPTGPVTRLERAREIVRRLIDGVDPVASPAALLFAAGDVTDAVPGFARNREALRSALAGAGVRTQTDDLDGAIARARTMLGGPGVIHVVTDHQHPPAPAADVVVHAIDATEADNASVAAIDWSPRHPLVGERVTVTARVRTTGDAPGPIYASFTLGDATQRIAFDPASESAITGVLTAPEAGVAELRVELPPDDFDDDNTRTARIRVRERWVIATLGEVRPVSTALAPPGAERTRFELREALDPAGLLEADAVLCAPGGGLSLAFQDALAAAHDRASPILWIVHTREQADAFIGWLDQLGDDATARVAGATSGSAPVLTGDGAAAFPALAGSGVLDDVGIAPMVVFDPEPRGWRALLRVRDGGPLLLASERAGVLAFDPAAPSLAQSPALPILAHELMRRLLDARPLPEQPENFPEPETDHVMPPVAPPVASTGEHSWPSVTDRRAMTRRERPLAPWLTLAALALLAGEPLVRGGGARA